MMRYDWTPASEPPDTERRVLFWMQSGRFVSGRYSASIGYAMDNIVHGDWPTNWRDVKPPK